MKAKTDDVVHNTVKNLYFFLFQAFLKNVCNDIVTILLWSEFVYSRNDFVDYLCDLVPWKFFEDALNDTAASPITTEVKQVLFNQRQQKLNLPARQVQHNALQNVVSFLTEHHSDEFVRLELRNNLHFAIKRQPYKSFLDYAATVLIVGQRVDLLQHAGVELVNALLGAFFEDELGYIVAEHILHQAGGVHRTTLSIIDCALIVIWGEYFHLIFTSGQAMLQLLFRMLL